MTGPRLKLRPQLAPDPADAPRESRKVSTVAAMLELDTPTVYVMVEDGTLEAHTIGKRGIRIYLDSVADYQAGRTRKPVRGPASDRAKIRQKARRNAASSAALKSALETLYRDGTLARPEGDAESFDRRRKKP